jgi:hypothetical protein
LDFINYNPSKEGFYANDGLDDQMDLEEIALEHGEIQLIMVIRKFSAIETIRMEDETVRTQSCR